MSKYFAVLPLIFGSVAKAGGIDFCDIDPFLPGCSQNHYSMPEPSAIPEIAVCLAIIGFLAWRQYKHQREQREKNSVS
jgi:hypothetical protein